jgi:hypothetical protein
MGAAGKVGRRTSMQKSSLGLPEACRWLRKTTGVHVTYRRLYSAVLDGAVPAVKDESGSRWVIKAADLDAIASHFLASE